MSDIKDKLKKTTYLALKSKSTKEAISHIADALTLLEQKHYEITKEEERLKDKIKAKKPLPLKPSVKNEPLVSYFSVLLSAIPDGVLFLNKKGQILACNAKAETLLQKKELFNKRFWNYFPDDFFGFSLASCLNYEVNYNTKFLNINNLKQVELTTKFIHSSEETREGMLIVLRDITEIEELKRENLREVKTSELGKALTTVVHEIKNPLGAIRGFASLLARDLEENRPLKEKVDYILEASISLENMINSILQYSKPLSLKKAPCNLCKLVEEVLQSIKASTSFSKKIEVLTHFPTRDLHCLVDKEQMKLAFFNLLINAYQAMENEGKITLYLTKRNTGCLITISDTGKGMSNKQIEHIFSPFFTTKESGNGLGLSETKKIISAHEGSIDVHSQLNKGATFILYLPGEK